MRRFSLLLLAAVAATAVGARLVWRGSEAAPERKPGLHVPEVIAANGVVEGAWPEVELRPEVGGTLAAVRVRENDRVAAGDVLAELSDAPEQGRVVVAAAEVAVAQADLERVVNGERPERRKALADTEKALKAVLDLAEARWKRVSEASAKGVASADQVEEARFSLARARAEHERAQSDRAVVDAAAREDEVAAARARVAAAEARLRLAGAELARTRLVAPSAGTVLRRLAEPGDVAGPTTARPVLVLADLSRLRVRAFVEELDAVRVRPGQPAVVTADGLPGKEFRGRVAALLPRMGRQAPRSDAPGEYQDVYFREVLIDLGAAPELPVNLRVRTRIDTRPEAEVGPAGVEAGGPPLYDGGVSLFGWPAVVRDRGGRTPPPQPAVPGTPDRAGDGLRPRAPPPREQQP